MDYYRLSSLDNTDAEYEVRISRNRIISDGFRADISEQGEVQCIVFRNGKNVAFNLDLWEFAEMVAASGLWMRFENGPSKDEQYRVFKEIK